MKGMFLGKLDTYKFKAYVIELIFKISYFWKSVKVKSKSYCLDLICTQKTFAKSRQSPNSSPHISTTEVTII